MAGFAWQPRWQRQADIERSGLAGVPIATLAGAHQLTVIDNAADFETAATVLTFQHRWLVPRRML